MIKYKLQCENLHNFESWFSSSDAYEKLNKGNYSLARFVVLILYPNL